MNKNKTLAVVVTVLSAFLTAISAYSGEDEDSLLTLGEVKCVWNGQYKSGHDKSCAVIKIMDRMRHERRRGTNLVEAVVIEKYLLDEISRTGNILTPSILGNSTPSLCLQMKITSSPMLAYPLINDIVKLVGAEPGL